MLFEDMINSYHYILPILTPFFRQLWHPRSPNLNPCDYNFWGTMKDNTQKEDTNISRQKFHCALKVIFSRGRSYLEDGAPHFKNLL
jgi:hypothetical protein